MDPEFEAFLANIKKMDKQALLYLDIDVLNDAYFNIDKLLNAISNAGPETSFDDFEYVYLYCEGYKYLHAEDIFKYFCSRINVNVTNNYGNTLLHVYIETMANDLINVVIDAGFDKDIKNNNDQTVFDILDNSILEKKNLFK